MWRLLTKIFLYKGVALHMISRGQRTFKLKGKKGTGTIRI